MIALWIILGCLAALALLFVVRALMVKDTAAQPENYEKPQLDLEAVVEKMQGAVQIPTISMRDDTIPDKLFLELHAYLEKTFPRFHAVAEKRVVACYSLMYKIEGTDPSLKPALFMGHQDVVPPQESG